MTYTGAAKILEQEKNKFLDEWIDYGGVAEAYNIAINLLENQEKTKLNMAHEMVSNSIIMYQGKEIVRCKDCVHWDKSDCDVLRWIEPTPGEDWFCADGERKE